MDDIDALVRQSASKLNTKFGGAAPDRQPSGPRDQSYIGGFVESALSSSSEFFLGAEPTPGANEFRMEHPIAGFVSEVATPALGYGASAKAASTFEKYGAAVEKFAEKGGNALTKGARKAVALGVPVEGARVVGTGLVNPDQIGETMKESLFNLGFEAVGGGVFGALTAGGKVDVPKPMAPVGTDLRAPNQIRLRELTEKVATLPEDQRVNMLGEIARLESEIRLEKVGDKTPLKLELDNEGDGREISRLFKDQSSKGGNIRKARLVRSSEDFADDLEKDRVINAAGLGGKFDAVQLPRYVGFAQKTGEPSLPKNTVRVYHSGSGGEGQTGRWVSTDKTYASNYRPDTPLHYLDLPNTDPRVNNLDYPDQGIAQGFTFNFELTTTEATKLVKIKRDSEVTNQWAKKVSDDLMVRGRMTTVDDNTLMAKEKGGMYVLARKITGKLDEAKASDEWVIWRTDQPGRFIPEVTDFADKMAARMAFLRQDNLGINPERPASIMDQTKLLVSQTPIREFRDADEKLGHLADGASRIATKLGFKPGEAGSNFAVNRGKALVEQYLTPKLYQFRNNPVAKYVIGHADRAFAQSKFIAQKIINGEPIDDAAKGFSKIFGDPDTTGTYKGLRSIKSIVDDLDQEDLNKLQDVADIVAGSDDAIKSIDELRAAGEISEKLHRALKDFDALDNEIVTDIVNHQHSAGRNDLNPLKGHLMLSRVWDGDYRAPIVNEGGEFLYVAGGKTPEAADKLAKEIIETSGLRGVKHIPAERFDAINDLKLAGQISTRSKDYGVLSAANKKLRSGPMSFRERQGTGGYKKEFSRKEMFDRLSSHVNERYNYMARLSVDTALEKELGWLAANDPKAFGAVADRLRQMEGKPGAVSQFVNAATDKILKPVMGRNSATKLTGYTNEYFSHTQLGMGNAAFPALNAITFVQTVLPELAFVMNAADNRVMRDYYDVFLAGGKDLKPRGNIGALSPMKLLIKSFQQMKNGKNDALYGEFLSRAHREGVIDPQLLNEFIGKTSEMSTKISDVMKGEEPMINLIRTWSGWLPSKSERFARGQAFTTGYLMGRDVLGLSDEALYAFSRKFTERTMFNYATQDRATLMTGPVGRMFGLFKNWQAHYIFSMLQYAEEGYRYGNWSPLMWQMGGTASVGGVAALPLYGVADGFSKMANDQSLMANIYSAFGGTDPDSTTGGFSDAVFMGLPAFFGVSLTGNAAAPFHDPARDAAALMSFPQWDRMRRLGQAVGDAIDNWALTGDHPISNPDTRDMFVAALAPKAIARSMQITEDNALKSLNTGNVILKDMSLAEKLMWSVGVTPRRVGLAYEAADELWKDQAKRKAATTKYGKLWANAQAEGNWGKLEELRQEAMVLGLDISSITKSASSFKEKKSTEMIERQFSPEARAKLQSLGLPGF